ncbi:MAG TPA: hypothetical protein VFF50_07550 [Candidatus Deferrimicrobiaceae bacterium]|nr:hypothetical protein [Candidatus Deferrimicrobiaceae bacterium]
MKPEIANILYGLRTSSRRQNPSTVGARAKAADGGEVTPIVATLRSALHEHTGVGEH